MLKKNNASIIVIFLVFLLLPRPASAASYGVASGTEMDTDSSGYSYLGLFVANPIGKNISITGKLWLDYLRYSFDQDGGRDYTSAPGIQPAIGISKSFSSGFSGAFSIGWESRNNVVRPAEDRPKVSVKGVTNSVVFQAELDKWMQNNSNANFMISYSTDSEFIWSRLRLKKGVSYGHVPIRLGIDLIGMGNSDYKAFEAGPLVEFYWPKQNASVILRGGYKNSTNINNGAYGGIELYHGF